MTVTNLSTLRKNIFSAIDEVVEYNEPLIINTKKGNAVIISEDDYNSLKESVFLASIPGFVKKIKDGEKDNLDEMAMYNPNEEW